MLQNIDLKLIFSIGASIITIVVYYPYIKDIFLEKTKPHIYTWLIWLNSCIITSLSSIIIWW